MENSQIQGARSLIGNFYRCVETSRGYFLVIDTEINEESVITFEYIKCTAEQAQQLQDVKAGQQMTIRAHTEPADQTWSVKQLLIADSIRV